VLYEHRASDLLKRMDVINTMVDCVPQVLGLVTGTSLTAAQDDFTRLAYPECIALHCSIICVACY